MMFSDDMPKDWEPPMPHGEISVCRKYWNELLEKEKVCDQLQAQLTEAREALNKYGVHLRNCTEDEHILAECSCGFQEALNTDKGEG